MVYVRPLDKGMGIGVANRTVFRKSENWEQVARRVAFGNTLLVPGAMEKDYRTLFRILCAATTLLSGRHLQHGDYTQPDRNMEVFTNCSTSATATMLFYLLLNGSGVGRCYDDELMLVDWRNLPKVVLVMSEKHPDYNNTLGMLSAEEARAEFAHADHWIEVDDSREGWAFDAVQPLEVMAFEGIHRDKTVVIDFSKVRPKGSPIGGMQSRPASGPVPLMQALKDVAALRDRADWEPWKQAMYVDHYLAACVLVGGARRAARIAIKHWKQKGIFEFINIKNSGDLWSANNSVAVDEEFWKKARKEGSKAHRVAMALFHAQYDQRTGEPGILNVGKLTAKNDNLEQYRDGEVVNPNGKFELSQGFKNLYKALANAVLNHHYQYIVNPCGEIVLFILGGYCVIGDVVPYHAETVQEAREAIRATVRVLMRTNTMRSLYSREVSRTNRIGVSLTGIHEFAWKFFGLSFRDLIDEEKSRQFWETISIFKRDVRDEAERYAKELSEILGYEVAVPHTDTTIKPAGTTSKLFGLSEGAHLPAFLWYLRWVQYKDEDPVLQREIAKGFPVRKLEIQYKGHHIVGYPTVPEIVKIGMPYEKIVTAAMATPAEQFQWVRLLEKYWIRGVAKDGVTPLEEYGNQISYTLKYDPEKVPFEEYCEVMLREMPTVRAISVMPQVDATKYEYQPEESISRERFLEVMAGIKDQEFVGTIDERTLECNTGACPL